jgi:hypothetical protein
MLKWLDARTAVELGNDVGNELRQLLASEKGAKTPKNRAKRMQKLARIVEWTSAQSAQHRFNSYQKAKFGNALRWSLKDNGFAPDFIEEVVTLILARM